MKLYLVRHGESTTEGKGIYQGQLDTDLTPRGEEQIIRIALRLKDESFDIIYSSDLKRASKTTEAIHKFHPEIRIILDDRLREISHGDFQGKAYSENLYNTVTGDKYEKKAPNGENFYDHRDRVKSFIDDCLKSDKDTLIVSHGGTIRIILHLLLNVPKEKYCKNQEYRIGNAGLFVLEIEDNNVEMLLENSTEHLN